MGISTWKPDYFTLEKSFDDFDFPWAAGTEGDDVLYSDADPQDDIYHSIYYGLAGDDRLIGGDRADELYGGEGKDSLEGGRGDDYLFGGEEDDVLEGGRGADHLDGGDGLDTASYASSGNGVMVDLAAGRGYAGDAYGDTLVSVENVIGSAHRDYIWGDNDTNSIKGGAGDDQLFGYGGSDLLQGEAGDDLLFGGDDGDVLVGGTGNDALFGEGGGDSMTGGAGDDRLVGGDGNDGLTGGAGADTLEGGDGFDTAWYHLTSPTDQLIIDVSGAGIGGDAEGDTYSSIERIYVEGGQNHVLRGDAGINELTVAANSGSTIEAFGGDDRIYLMWSGGNDIDGGAGVDSLNLFNGVDTSVDLANGWVRQSGRPDDTIDGIENVFSSSGNDEIFGSSADNRLFGDWGADEIYGRDGRDRLEGGTGNDRLDGGRGDDELSGGADNDWINGNDGDDVLTGNAGADTFVFITGRNDTDLDVVTDFEIGVDRLDLDRTIIGSFGEFQGRTSQVGADAVIDTGAGSITLQGINMFDLTASDFIF